MAERFAFQTAQLRMWNYRVAAGAAVAVVVVLLGAVVVFQWTRPAAVPTAAPGQPDVAQSAAAKPAESGPNQFVEAVPPPTAPIPIKPSTPAAPSKKSLPPLPKEKSADSSPLNAAQKEAFLEALGGLSAAHLYQSYLNIGLLADGVDAKAYPPDEAKSTLSSILNFMDLVEGKLAKLDRSTLDTDDQEALDRIKTATDLLRLQAKTLLAFWAGGTKEQADHYHAARKAASAGLNKVLGLDAK